MALVRKTKMVDKTGREVVKNGAGEIGRVLCFSLMSLDFKSRGHYKII